MKFEDWLRIDVGSNQSQNFVIISSISLVKGHMAVHDQSEM